MLHILYLIAFTTLAFLAIGNLIRNLVQFSVDSQRYYAPTQAMQQSVPHPELLDETGRLTNEPLLVMKSITVDDARARLDALYNDLPSYNNSADSEESAS
jgi:Protein of unknown function (DUF2973)